MGSKYISTETTIYEDGSKTVEDVYQKADGTLFVNTYNVTADELRHDHVAMDENGNFMGGHEERESSWKNRNYIFKALSNLTFEELQLVESCHQNEYIRNSAKKLMQFVSTETIESFKNYTKTI